MCQFLIGLGAIRVILIVILLHMSTIFNQNDNKKVSQMTILESYLKLKKKKVCNQARFKYQSNSNQITIK